MISLLGLFPWLSKFAFAAGSELLTAPCSFPFDASRLGTALDVQFIVKVYRNYIFTLEFHHNGGDDAKRVDELVGNGNYKYFTRESSDSDHPVSPEASNTLQGVKQVQEGVRTGKVVTRATDFRGAIPIHIRVSRADNHVLEVMTDETISTLGKISGGGGRFDRMVTVEALKPGRYRLEVNTTQDSPRFHAVSIRLGITYHPNTLPLPLTK
jgi:Domain of unknown function (DUF5625)